MRWRWLILLATLSFVVTLLLHAPAPLLYAWTAGKAATTLRLHGVQGTLADGGFAALTVRDRTVLTDARWTLRPAWLALLQLTADVETGGDTVLRARVSRTPLGKLKLSDVDALSSVKSLLGLAGQAVLPVEGQVRLALQTLALDAGLPTDADGSIEIRGLAWALAREPVVLGDYTAALTTGDSGIVASMANDGGPLELSGEARLQPDRSYDVHIQFRPRPDASPSLVSLMRSAGSPDAQGWYHLRRQGTL